MTTNNQLKSQSPQQDPGASEQQRRIYEQGRARVPNFTLGTSVNDFTTQNKQGHYQPSPSFYNQGHNNKEMSREQKQHNFKVGFDLSEDEQRKRNIKVSFSALILLSVK